jgi:transcriptional regulator with XRE-family HTH domain
MSSVAADHFAEMMVAFRKGHGLTQGQLADRLGISRKTYVALEVRSWLPRARERSYFIKRLHDIHPPAAKALADALGKPLEDYVQVRPVTTAGAVVPLEADHAKLVLDSAILGVAEQLDMSPRALRPIVAALLERLAAAGMPMGQAATIAKAPPRPSP